MSRSFKIALGVSTMINAALLTALYQAQPEKPMPTTVTCRTDDALRGGSFVIDLKRPLGPQQCHYNERDPSQIMCDRIMTVKCALP